MFKNFPGRIAARLVRTLVFPWGRVYSPPSDQLGHAVARLMIEPSLTRDRVTAGMFIHRDAGNPVGRLELAMLAAPEGEAIEAKIRNGVRAGSVTGLTEEQRVSSALDKGQISAAEATRFRSFSALRRDCIMVDDFPQEIERKSVARESASVTSLDSVASRKTAA